MTHLHADFLKLFIEKWRKLQYQAVKFRKISPSCGLFFIPSNTVFFTVCSTSRFPSIHLQACQRKWLLRAITCSLPTVHFPLSVPNSRQKGSIPSISISSNQKYSAPHQIPYSKIAIIPRQNKKKTPRKFAFEPTHLPNMEILSTPPRPQIVE